MAVPRSLVAATGRCALAVDRLDLRRLAADLRCTADPRRARPTSTGSGSGARRVARLMRERGIAGVSRRGKKRLKTTVPAKEAPSAADLVRREFRPAGSDRLWVADIKYVSIWQGYLFLACVIDAWSRNVVGCSMRDDLRYELGVDALGMAVTRPRPRPGLVHHSDRGSRYTSLAFARRSRRRGSCPAWAAAVTPSTTPSRRASSPRSRPSCSTGTASTAATRPGSRSSTESRASTTADAALDPRRPKPRPLRGNDARRNRRRFRDSRCRLNPRCQRKPGSPTSRHTTVWTAETRRRTGGTTEASAGDRFRIRERAGGS